MVTCHIDAAIPENRSVTERMAARAQREIGTAVYRAYLQRLIPEVTAMRAEIDAETQTFRTYWHVPPSSCATCWVRRSGTYRSGRVRSALRTISVSVTVVFAISCRACWPSGAADHINRRTGDLTIGFGGDTNQAAQFARSVPDFVLKGRFADLVRLDLQALEHEMGFDLGSTRTWWRRLLGK